jgi:hypothetical protein
MNSYFSIYPFSAVNLSQSLSNSFLDSSEIKNKSQFLFFLNYLEASNTRTILIENDYHSQIYINSFLPHYQQGFFQYPKVCKRVHFFGSFFTIEDFNEIIYSQEECSINLFDSYIGYVVVRPLPDSIFGESLLRPLNSEEGFFNSLATYRINFYGLEFEINSLPFLEQDKYITTCANIGLWIALNKTSQLFHHRLPEISEINNLAGQSQSLPGRVYGSGLEAIQICNVLKSIGLESEVRTNFTEVSHFKALIHAYNNLGIPILFGYRSGNDSLHLVTIIGFKISGQKSKVKQSQMPIYSDNISALYCFDDQSGPYSRITFEKNGKFKIWNDSIIEPHILIIPMIEEIRLQYESIVQVISPFNYLLTSILQFKKPHDWKIELTSGTRLKSIIRHSADLSIGERKKILLSQMPNYIWSAKLQCDNALILELLFDATSFQANYSAIDIIYHLADIKPILQKVFIEDEKNLRNYFKGFSAEYYFNLIIKSFEEKNNT